MKATSLFLCIPLISRNTIFTCAPNRGSVWDFGGRKTIDGGKLIASRETGWGGPSLGNPERRCNQTHSALLFKSPTADHSRPDVEGLYGANDEPTTREHPEMDQTHPRRSGHHRWNT
jgi:hypothetical protein